tara:strand:+ start:127 stop:330 length:204 start_codon:yes stop_codon:yes gene_type:complete
MPPCGSFVATENFFKKVDLIFLLDEPTFVVYGTYPFYMPQKITCGAKTGDCKTMVEIWIFLVVSRLL